jgi:hypothetical protein
VTHELERNLAGTGAALLAGFVTQWASRRKGSTAHKIASPVAAVAGGIAAAMLQGEGAITIHTALAGLQFGMQAVFAEASFSGVKAQVTKKF